MKLYHLSLVLFAATLCLCESYTLWNSWAVASNDAVSEEEAVPVVLVDNSGLWKPAYPHSVLQDGAEKPKESVKSKTKDAAYCVQGVLSDGGDDSARQCPLTSTTPGYGEDRQIHGPLQRLRTSRHHLHSRQGSRCMILRTPAVPD